MMADEVTFISTLDTDAQHYFTVLVASVGELYSGKKREKNYPHNLTCLKQYYSPVISI